MKILAIGAHPNDIEFGCGGTLYKYRLKGHHIEMLVLTDGGRSGDAETRKAEQEQAAKLLGARTLHWGGFLDTEVPESARAIRLIDKIVESSKPDLIFTHSPEDTHQDHRHTALATIAAARNVRNLLFYETCSTKNFRPGVFVDVSSLIDKKFEFISAHVSQQNKTRIPGVKFKDLAKSIGETRGLNIFVKYAEGFDSHRLVINI